MGYEGNIAEIPLGVDGLRTDDPNSKLTAGSLIRALNITMQGGCVEKDFGSRRWNSSALPGAVRAAFDWWPDTTTQRIMVICSDGKVYRFKNYYTAEEVGSSDGGASTLTTTDQCSLVAGGAEETGNSRKLFLYTGLNPIQVISGDGTTRASLSRPVPSWTGTQQPAFGVIHQGRHMVFLRGGSTVFASLATDHEDFLTDPLPFECSPGEGEALVDMFVFRGKLFAMKYPFGLHVLVDTDSDASNWYFTKINGGIGSPGARCAVPVFDDVLFANEYGSISSLTATDQTGDVKSADLFAQLRCQRFLRDEASPDGRFGARQAIYYKDRKTAMFTYRSRSGLNNDLICYVDFSSPAGTPKVFWNDKDQPTALFVAKDNLGIERPFYGADDGYLYQMDQPDRWVGVASGSPQTAYRGEFWTPFADLSNGDPAVSSVMKEFDQLEIKYLPCGDWKLTVEAWIDGKYSQTFYFNMGGDSDLDSLKLDSSQKGRCDPEAERTEAQKFYGRGKRVSFRCYNENLGQNFKVLSLTVYYRPSGQSEQAKK